MPALTEVPAAGAGEYALPASFAQRRLWMLYQLDPSSTAYNVPLGLWLAGPLDCDRLRTALRNLAARHETLRTRFGVKDGDLAQIVAEDAAVAFVREEVEDEAAGLQLAQIAARRPFSLSDEPLWRVLLVAVGAHRHLLLITLHHTICDGWSIGLLIGELGRFYTDTDAVLAPLPLQYADYAAWQRDRLAGAAGAVMIERNRCRLDGAPEYLDLPVDRRRSSARSGKGGSLTLAIPSVVALRLRDLAARCRATPMMAHAAIFAALLARWCNQSQIVLGVPIAGRDHSDTDQVIGLFVNTVVVRFDLRGDPCLDELLERVRGDTLAALSDQALPFERLVEALRPARNLAQNPLFQVLFNFQNLPLPSVQFADLQAEPVDLGPAAPQFDLAANLTKEADGTVVARLDYDASLFERDTIAALAERWLHLARAAAAQPTLPVGALPLTSAADTIRQLAVSGPLSTPTPEWCVHEAILARARAEPRRVFVSGDDSDLDGAALVTAAELVAGRLAALGVGRGDRVGVYLGRGARLVAGLLGVLAAGAAYVPLDPLYPPMRVASVLDQAGVRAIVSETALRGDLPDRHIVLLDEDGPCGRIATRAGQDDLAYVIFTSGSTGVPKGVAVGHRALANLLASMTERLGAGPADNWLATTTATFDIAALELFGPLLTGGQLVVAGSALASDGEALGKLLEDTRTTVMQATPSGWRLLLSSGWPGKSDLKALCGGESLPRDLATALLGRTREVWNLYGPTETTIWSAAGPVAADAGDVAPVGPPIANTRIHVLDRWLQPVPVGAVGQIHIAGEGLSWGYIGRPDLTAERFIADQHGPPGSRLYRTGDVGRRRRDGLIEFLGRNDQQVKVRGYRIEPGEVEVALRSLDGVADAAAALRGAGESAELVAWVVSDGGAAPDPTWLRPALMSRLPPYMVPARFVAVPALPLAPNGKLDRSRLPDPPAERNATGAPPRNAMEAAMLAIWRQVLGRGGFGIDNDFFSLGGHSLLAVRLMTRIRERFAANLGLRELFLHPTVAGLSGVIANRAGDRPSPLTPLAAGAGVPLLMVPGAGGTPLYLRPLALALASDRAVWGFEAIGSDGTTEPLDSVEAIAETYLAEARRQLLGPPWLLVGHSFGSRIAYEMARKAESAGEAVLGLAIFDTAAPVLNVNPFAAVANDETRILVEVAAAIEVLFGESTPADVAATAALRPAVRFERMAARLRASGWQSEEAALRGLCNVYRSALRTHYRARGGIAAPLLLVKAAVPLTIPGDTTAPQLARLLEDPLWGWGRLCAPERVTLADADGNHITMLSAAHAAGLAARLQAWAASCEFAGTHPNAVGET